jgi:hypothetical protein
MGAMIAQQREAARLQRPGPLNVWGDDTLLFTPQKLDESEWAEASLSLGFKSKPRSGGRTFLQRWFENGRYYGSIARAYQQTWFNEKGGRDSSIELLGLYARLLHTVDNPRWARFEGALLDPSTSETLRHYGVHSWWTLQTAVRSDLFARELTAYLDKVPTALTDWAFIGRMSDTARAAVSTAEAILGSQIYDQGIAAAALDMQDAPTLEDIRSTALALKEDEAMARLTFKPELRRRWEEALADAKDQTDGGSDSGAAGAVQTV